MDQLSGFLAEDVRSKEPTVVPAEDQLDEPVRGAGDDAPGVAREAGTASLGVDPSAAAACSVMPTIATSGIE